MCIIYLVLVRIFSWTGSAWESLAGTVDLSAYLEKTEASTIYETKSNVAGLQLIVNNHTAAIGEIQESQLEIEGSSKCPNYSIGVFFNKSRCFHFIYYKNSF